MFARKTLFTVIAAGAMMALTGAAQANLINTYPNASSSNIGTSASSIEPNTGVNGPDRTVIEVNNGFNPATGEHAAGTQQSWRSNNGQSIGDQWIQWELPGSFQLGSIQVWNFNDFSRRAAGIRKVDIYLSNVAVPGDPEEAATAGNWTHWAVDAVLEPGTGSGDYTGFDLETVVGLSLPASPVRFIRFEADSTFKSDGISITNASGTGLGDGANVVGLAQIEFFEVPEPASLALIGLGGLMMVKRRR